jgi:hypothetical protein
LDGRLGCCGFLCGRRISHLHVLLDLCWGRDSLRSSWSLVGFRDFGGRNGLNCGVQLFTWGLGWFFNYWLSLCGGRFSSWLLRFFRLGRFWWCFFGLFRAGRCGSRDTLFSRLRCWFRLDLDWRSIGRLLSCLLPDSRLWSL